MQITGNLGLKKPEGTDVVNIDDLNYNADILDQEVNKRIINSGGVLSIQAGADASKPSAGTAGRLYIATDTNKIYRDTGSAWQLIESINWNDITGKPASFTPVAHKSTHATGGSDALTPADIGAIANSAGSVTDTNIGNRTADQAQTPTGATGTITQLFSWIANRIRAILGTTNWYDAAPTTLFAAKSHIDAAAPHSGHALTTHTHTTVNGVKITSSITAPSTPAVGDIWFDLN